MDQYWKKETQWIIWVVIFLFLHGNKTDYNISGRIKLNPGVTVSCLWRSSSCGRVRLKVSVTWQPSHALSHQALQSYAGWHATLTLPRLHPDIFLRPDKEWHGWCGPNVSHHRASTVRHPTLTVKPDYVNVTWRPNHLHENPRITWLDSVIWNKLRSLMRNKSSDQHKVNRLGILLNIIVWRHSL